MKAPPFKITPLILQLSQDISLELGILKGAKLYPLPIELRRKNRIKTIHSSLAIEGNTLDIDQITKIINGKKILAPEKDILEVQNAIAVYDKILSWNPLLPSHLQEAHKLLMQNLIPSNGKWRNKGVGIFKDKKVSHVAPSHKRVPFLMEELFNFINNYSEIPWLLKACIFHYELEFIHPFDDGNGRMGRLWQQLLLIKENPVFEFISVESIIKTNQNKYYENLEICDHLGESTVFIEFSLKQILEVLREYTSSASSEITNTQQRLIYTQTHFSDWFSRKQYLLFHKNISSATASRDLLEGVKNNLLEKKGDKNQVLYKFKN